MEDDIDRSELNLFEKKDHKEKQETQKKSENPKEKKDYLYIYIPEGGEWEDFIITDTSEKAVQLVKKIMVELKF